MKKHIICWKDCGPLGYSNKYRIFVGEEFEASCFSGGKSYSIRHPIHGLWIYPAECFREFDPIDIMLEEIGHV